MITYTCKLRELFFGNEVCRRPQDIVHKKINFVHSGGKKKKYSLTAMGYFTPYSKLKDKF